MSRNLITDDSVICAKPFPFIPQAPPPPLRLVALFGRVNVKIIATARTCKLIAGERGGRAEGNGNGDREVLLNSVQ